MEVIVLFLAQSISYLDFLEYISPITDILLLIVTVVSVVYAYKAYKHQKERSKKEAACQLAKYYANNIICKFSDVVGILDETGVGKIVKETFPLRIIEKFDKEEMQQLLKDAGRTSEDLKFDKIDPAIILRRKLASTYSVSERDIITKGYIKKDNDGKEIIVDGIYLVHGFFQEIVDLLNELEWFAVTAPGICRSAALRCCR